MKAACIVLWLFCSFISVVFASNTDADTASHTAKRLWQHRIELGVISRVGKENTYQYNDFEKTTTKSSNYPIALYSRFITLRLSHLYNLNNHLSVGGAYGAGVFVQLHDIRAMMPLLAQVQYEKVIGRRWQTMAIERMGYAFFINDISNNPLLATNGVAGGFSNEALIGVGYKIRKQYVQLLIGYRFQHLRGKSTFYPDQNLRNLGGQYALLPSAVHEVSTGYYHFIYTTIGIPF